MIRLASAEHLEQLLENSFLPIWEAYQKRASIQKVARRMFLARELRIRQGAVTLTLTRQAQVNYTNLIEPGLEALDIARDEANEQRVRLMQKGIKPLMQEKHFILQEIATHNRLKKFLNREVQKKFAEIKNKRLWYQDYETDAHGLPVLDNAGVPKTKGQPQLVHYNSIHPDLIRKALLRMRTLYFDPWLQNIEAQIRPLRAREEKIDSKLDLAKGNLERAKEGIASQYVSAEELKWAKWWNLFLAVLNKRVSPAKYVTKITDTLYRFKNGDMRVWYKIKGPNQFCIPEIDRRSSTTYSNTRVQNLDLRCR